MTPFIATAFKELLLLGRDKSGLLVLFAMPAVLVLVITLVQNNMLKSVGESDIDILFVDHDRAMVGQRMATALSQAKGVHLIKTIDEKTPDKKTAIQAVARGDFQLCLVIPEGLTASVKANARAAAEQALAVDNADVGPAPHAAEVEIYFDPAVMGGFRSAVHHLLQLMVLQIEVQEKINQMAELLPGLFQNALEKALGPMAAEMIPQAPLALNMEWRPDPILKIRASSALGTAAVKTPDAVQQNVPAWSLFGIFFIVLPMAGSFIKERLYGVEHRILSLPVSYMTIASGKVCAYMLVCLVQFSLILFIGTVILPLFGTPRFELAAASAAALPVALCAILAASGYGILLGTAVKSYEQASMFGPISIVIAAALGGIMVPVYAMPTFMQKISVISPLAWAQNAFLELFVRGGTLQTVLPHMASLLIFAIACIAAAWLLFQRRININGRS